MNVELIRSASNIEIEPISRQAKEGSFNESDIFGVTYDLPIVMKILNQKAIKTPSDQYLRGIRQSLIDILGFYAPANCPMICIDGESIQRALIQRVGQLRSNRTLVISFDDTIEVDDYSTFKDTSYFDQTGDKMGCGMKPGFNEKGSPPTLQDIDFAVVLDMGIWSGKTILPTVSKLQAEGIGTRVITGFIKSKAADHLTKQRATVESLLYADYDDWAETRDLLTLFIKSGFFIGRRSGKFGGKVVPYGVFMGNFLTYYTQPSSKLNKYYEVFEDIDYEALSDELLRLSLEFWQEVEKDNPQLTLGLLRERFPYRFGLPFINDNQIDKPSIFSSNDKPSQAIRKMM